MARACDAHDVASRPPSASSTASVPRESDGVITRLAAVLHVVRADRHDRAAQHAPVERLDVERSRVTARHERDAALPNVTCCGARSASSARAADGELAACAGRDPQPPVRRVPDVVRGEPGREVADVSKRPGVDAPRRAPTRSPARPRAASRRAIDRQVARPARQRTRPTPTPRTRIDRNDAASPRVGHERMHAVGMRRRIARLDEAAEHVAHPRAIDDRQRSLAVWQTTRGRRRARPSAGRGASRSSRRCEACRGRRPRAATRRRT